MSDPHLETRSRTLRGQGVDPNERYYFPVTGYNFRLTNVACAILCAQLERVEMILQRRRHIFALYRELLQEVPGIGFQPIAPWATISPWVFCITVDEEKYGHNRTELMHILAGNGIETRPFFIPLHGLPPFREASRNRKEHLPISDALAASGMNLPTFSSMKDAAIHQVAKVITEARG
jgi:perosamine synthetase